MPAPLSSLVVPTDFSEGSQLALLRVLALPLAPKCKVTVLHALPDDIPGRLRQQAIDEATRSVEKQLARARAQAVEAGLGGVQLVGDVVEGETPHEILKRAHTVEADLVVLGRHGRRPVADLFIGTTAQKVVRESDVPVLLVQLAAPRPYARALAAVELKRSSIALLRTAQGVLAPSVKLSVLHCSSVPWEDFVTLAGGERESLRARYLDDARAELAALCAKVDGARVAPQVQGGDARVLILEQAAAEKDELVVVGTRAKRGKVARVVLGSTAEWIVTHAKCDVLVIPH